MSDAKIHQCVYEPWYQFKVCTIKTCKNWTQKTKSCCLHIDRAEPTGNKVISDAELHLFKFDRSVSPRYVALKRKRAVQRIQAALVLRDYIAWIKANIGPSPKRFYGKWIVRAESSVPLKIKRLRFENWMWPHLVSEDTYKEFCSGKTGLCTEMPMHAVLAVTPARFSKLVQEVNSTQGEVTDVCDRSSNNRTEDQVPDTRTS